MTLIELPDFCLVLLFGDRADTVLTFAARHLGCGTLCAPDAVEPRLATRTLTAVDVSTATRDDLKRLARAATATYARLYAIAIETDADLVSRRLGTISVVEQFKLTDRNDAKVTLRPISTDRRGEQGPFDIIGDVHGCADELTQLLDKLGYTVTLTGAGEDRRADVVPPPGRRAFFVGDLCDRGPNTPDVLRIVMAMVASGSALCVAGNHDVGLIRWLEGKATSTKHGLERSAEQFAREPASFHAEVLAFLIALKGHLWVDGGGLVVAHAGVQEAMIGRSSGRVRAFSLYGDTDNKTAADGLPTRYHWALEYRGAPAIVYGHTPVADVGWVNNTACIDTGCCFGGTLTALRWPERDVVSVPARATCTIRGRPFGHPPARPAK